MNRKKQKYLTKKIILGLITGSLFLVSGTGAVYALPQGGTVAQGTAAIDTSVANTTQIKQTSERAIINWNSFNVGAGEKVNFIQPGTASITLNRVNAGGGLSTIGGQINANGNVVLINPSGVMFANGSSVNAAGIVVSTANIASDANFMNSGDLTFKQDKAVNPEGSITIGGTLTASVNGAAQNTALNITEVKPATSLAVINNRILLVADKDITVDATGSLTAVTKTTLTQSGTVGVEGFSVADTRTTAAGKIILRADQNANDTGTVTLNNTAPLQSPDVYVYYNPAIVNPTATMQGGTYKQKDYTTYAADQSNYLGKIAGTVTLQVNRADGTNAAGTAVSANRNIAMLVNDIRQVQAISESGKGNLAGSYAQGQGIDAAGTEAWNSGSGFDPLGNTGNAFTGSFSGFGGTAAYTLSNVGMNRTSAPAGLFGVVNGGSLSTVTAVDFAVTGGNQTGGLVGSLQNGSIYNSSVAGIVKGVDETGGLAGHVEGNSKITYSSNAAAVSGTGTGTGGIAGTLKDSGLIAGSVNRGNITGQNQTGGLAGVVSQTAQIDHSYNRGQIVGISDTGGLAGQLKDTAKITISYNTNEATTLSGTVAAGSPRSTVGSVTGTTNTGGLVGQMNGGSVDTAYNAGNISGQDHTGGLVGTLTGGTITHAYNADNNTVIDSRADKNDVSRYYGFTYNGKEYTFDTEKQAYIVDGTQLSAATLATIPADKRVYNIRLAYRDAGVTGTGTNTGGLVGNMIAGSLEQVYNAGEVKNTGSAATTGALVGNKGASAVINNALFASADKGEGTVRNLSGVSNAYGGVATPAAEEKSLSDMQKPGTFAGWTDSSGKKVSDNTNQNEDWMVFTNQSAPSLKKFMNWININREFTYNGQGHNLITHDVAHLYGTALFDNDSKGKNVKTDGIAPISSADYSALFKKSMSEPALYANSSKYVYDQAEMWSPQHGYYTDPKATLIITPVKLTVKAVGSRTYGEMPLAGYTGAIAGPSGTGYTVTITGASGETNPFVTGESATTALSGTNNLTYDSKSGTAFAYGDAQSQDAGSYTFTGDKFGGITANNSNYLISYEGTLTIKKADLYFTAEGKRVYGDTNTPANFARTGTDITTSPFVFKAASVSTDNTGSVSNDGKLKYWDAGVKDSLASMTGFSQPAGSTPYKLTKQADNAVITDRDAVATYSLGSNSFDGQLLSKNYNLKYAPAGGGSLEITKAPLSYDITGTFVYGTIGAVNAGGHYTNQNGTVSYNGLKSWDVSNAPTTTTAAQGLASVAVGAKPNVGTYSGSMESDTTLSYNGVSLAPSIIQNYNIKPNKYNVTVTKAPLVYTVNNDLTKVYGAAPNLTLAGSGSFSGWVYPEDTITSQPPTGTMTFGGVTGSSPVNNGNPYTITATGLTFQNYNITYVPGKMVVTKAPLTYTVSSVSKTYGDVNPANGGSYTGFIGSDAAALNTTKPSSYGYKQNGTMVTVDQKSNAGSYAITTAPEQFSFANYAVTAINEGTLTINKAPLKYNVSGSRTYGDLAADEVYRASVSGVKSWDTPTSVYGGTLQTGGETAAGHSIAVHANVGNYAGATDKSHSGITLDGSAGGNYELQDGDFTFTVNKANLVITADSTSRKYGEANPTFTYQATGLKYSDTVAGAVGTGSVSITTAAAANSNVGEYDLTPAGKNFTNYNVTYRPGVLNITKAPLTYTVNSASKTYGDVNPTITGTLGGFVPGETAAGLGNPQPASYSYYQGAPGNGVEMNEKTNAGTYKVTTDKNQFSLSNYEVTAINEGTLTINKASLVYNVSGSRTYGDAAAQEQYQVSFAGLKSWDTAETVYTGSQKVETAAQHGIANDAEAKTYNQATDKGVSKIALNGSAGGNYELQNGNFTFTVNKADLVITADSASRKYGEANPVFTYQAAGLKYSDTVAGAAGTGSVSITTTAAANSNVGEYDLTPAGKSFANYNVIYQKGQLEITKAPLIYTVNSVSKTYGEEAPVISGTLSGFKLSDQATLGNTAPAGFTAYDGSREVFLAADVNAGSYMLTTTANPFNFTNYAVTVVPGTLTVNKADLNFKVTGKMPYGSEPEGSHLNYQAVAVGSGAGELKAGDDAYVRDLSKLTGFQAGNGVTLYYRDDKGSLQRIGSTTPIRYDGSQQVIAYPLDASSNLGTGITSRNYNWHFSPASDSWFTVGQAPALPPSDSNRAMNVIIGQTVGGHYFARGMILPYVSSGGGLELDNKNGTRFLTVIGSGINISQAMTDAQGALVVPENSADKDKGKVSK